MTKPHRVKDMDLDEVSTVDVPANQYGLFVLAKRATDEGIPVDEYFDAETGALLDNDTLEEGDLVLNANGDLCQIQFEDGGDEPQFDGLEQRELETVGKSAFLDAVDRGGDELLAVIGKQLRDAVDDDARQDILTKALAAQATELAKARQESAQAMAIAKAAADREETSRYITKAADYKVGVAPEVLGPVLKRMAESMSYEDCSVIAGILESGTDIFKQFGLEGEADLDDPFGQIEAFAAEHTVAADGSLVKRAGDQPQTLSKAQLTKAFFDNNPGEYSRMKREAQRG